MFKVKYLGIIFDKQSIKLHEHAKTFETKIARSVGILNKLKYFLPSSVLLKLYYSLIHSHFNYGLVVWGSTYPTNLNKLKLFQNKAIRIVTSSHGQLALNLYTLKQMFCLCLNCLSLKQLNLFILTNLIC